MFTVLFAVARTVGWIAQWKEMIEDPSQRIGRPRQLYTGAPQRAYVPARASSDQVESPDRIKMLEFQSARATLAVHSERLLL
jgi:hypothetical protein